MLREMRDAPGQIEPELEPEKSTCFEKYYIYYIYHVLTFSRMSHKKVYIAEMAMNDTKAYNSFGALRA